MPGILNQSAPGAVFAPEWFIYRANITVADDPDHPEAVTSVLDLTQQMAGAGAQVWVVPVRNEGTGSCTVIAVSSGFGSLELVRPFQVWDVAALDSGQEVRFHGMLAVQTRLLITNIDPGSSWTLHVTHTSIPTN